MLGGCSGKLLRVWRASTDEERISEAVARNDGAHQDYIGQDANGRNCLSQRVERRGFFYGERNRLTKLS
jgi:hypothetical protein